MNQGGPMISPQVRQAVLDAPLAKCECGSVTFTEVVLLKKLPGLYFGSTDTQLSPIPVYVCSKCGKILSDMADDKDFARLVGKDALKALGVEISEDDQPTEAGETHTILTGDEQAKPSVTPLILQ